MFIVLAVVTGVSVVVIEKVSITVSFFFNLICPVTELREAACANCVATREISPLNNTKVTTPLESQPALVAVSVKKSPE
jgi:hypothetical protein